jgi:hypothetical protein
MRRVQPDFVKKRCSQRITAQLRNGDETPEAALTCALLVLVCSSNGLDGF